MSRIKQGNLVYILIALLGVSILIAAVPVTRIFLGLFGRYPSVGAWVRGEGLTLTTGTVERVSEVGGSSVMVFTYQNGQLVDVEGAPDAYRVTYTYVVDEVHYEQTSGYEHGILLDEGGPITVYYNSRQPDTGVIVPPSTVAGWPALLPKLFLWGGGLYLISISVNAIANDL